MTTNTLLEIIIGSTLTSLAGLVVFFVHRLIRRVDRFDLKLDRKFERMEKKHEEKFDKAEMDHMKLFDKTCSAEEKLTIEIQKINGVNESQSRRIIAHQDSLESFLKIVKNHQSRIVNNQSEIKRLGKDILLIKTKKS